MSDNNHSRLTQSMLESTRHHRLDMRLSANRLDVVIFSKREDNSLIYESFTLSPDENGSILKSLEETVYDNPLLLGDFEQTNIVVETSDFSIVPQQVADNSQLLEKILESSGKEIPGDSEIIVDQVKQLGCAVVMTIATDTLSFFNRAFNNPRIYHNLSPLIRYFSDRRRHGNTTGMFVNMRENSLDVVLFGNDSIRMANTIRFRAPSDAVYHILSLRQSLSVNDDTDEVLISGERDIRFKVINSLREFIPYVMPVIFPSAMFRAGRNSLNVPFDLIVLSLCE